MQSSKRKSTSKDLIGKKLKKINEDDEEIEKQDFTIMADSNVDALTAASTSTQTLSVSGVSNLNSTTVNSTLVVSGLQTGTNLNITGTATLPTVNSTTTSTGTLSSTGNLSVGGNSSFTGNVTVGGTSTFNGTVTKILMGSADGNKKLVLFQSAPATSDHTFYGFGINAFTFRYQVDNIGADHVFFAAATATTSTELARIKGNGNFGVGVNPSERLHVRGNALIQATSNTADAKFVVSSQSETRQSAIFLGTPLTAANKVALIADPTGAGGWSRSNLHFCLENSTGGTANDASASASVASSRMVITPVGNVGIGTGTTIPVARLEVNGNAVFSNSSDIKMALISGTASSNSLFQFGTGLGTSVNTAIIAKGLNSSGRSELHFCLNETGDANLFHTKMAIMPSGNVGIGLANGVTPNSKLHINGDLRVEGNIFASNDTARITKLTLNPKGSSNTVTFLASDLYNAVSRDGFVFTASGTINFPLSSAVFSYINSISPLSNGVFYTFTTSFFLKAPQDISITFNFPGSINDYWDSNLLSTNRTRLAKTYVMTPQLGFSIERYYTIVFNLYSNGSEYYCQSLFYVN